MGQLWVALQSAKLKGHFDAQVKDNVCPWHRVSVRLCYEDKTNVNLYQRKELPKLHFNSTSLAIMTVKDKK